MMLALQLAFLKLTDGIQLQDDGYYYTENAHYTATPNHNTDAEGNIISTTYSYTSLSNTYFFALNTQACFMVNAALFEQFGDPGGQLAWLEEKLKKARDNSKTVIIAGNISPGHPSCNR